jgi:diguanylate cyclase (GGDEF)-like protein
VRDEVRAAVDLRVAQMKRAWTTTYAGSSPDAIAELGDALAAFSSRVARRERELNRLFDEIAVERNTLLDAVLSRLYLGLSGVIPFDAIECAFLSDDGTSTVSFWKRGSGPAPSEQGDPKPIGGTRLREMLATGYPLIINDLQSHAASASGGDLERRMVAEGARSALTCPLIADGVPLGFLFFTSHQPGAFAEAHAAAFKRAAAQVSIVVQKTRAYGEVVGHNRVLLRETRRLQEAATTDALTGVLNRRALDAALATAWDRYEQDGVAFGVILADIDHFKQVNDTHGHAVGDRLLSQTARCLARGLRGADVFGRFGGEEFLAIVDTTSEATLADVAHRLRSQVARENPCGIAVTASLGVAVSYRFNSVENLLGGADRALYDAKGSGRNRSAMALSADEVIPLHDTTPLQESLR